MAFLPFSMELSTLLRMSFPAFSRLLFRFSAFSAFSAGLDEGLLSCFMTRHILNEYYAYATIFRIDLPLLILRIQRQSEKSGDDRMCNRQRRTLGSKFLDATLAHMDLILHSLRLGLRFRHRLWLWSLFGR